MRGKEANSCRAEDVFSLRAGAKSLERNQGIRESGPGGPEEALGDEAMKDAFVAAAVVFFAAIMSFFPSAWEPVSEAEARDLFEKRPDNP
jgi:hypothetical protein